MSSDAGRRRHRGLVVRVALVAAAAGVTACGGPTTAAPSASLAAPTLSTPSSGPAAGGPTGSPSAGATATPSDGSGAVAPPGGAPGGAVPAPGGPRPARDRVTSPGDLPADVLIPRLRVDSPLVRLGASPQGVMQVPADFDRAGWFTGGAAPGERGPAVLAGHVDSTTGPAVFYRLAELHQGDVVQVRQQDGDVIRFTVSRVERYAKSAFPTAQVYGPVPGPVLRLITCGGVFDRATGHYRDNVVVYANPA